LAGLDLAMSRFGFDAEARRVVAEQVGFVDDGRDRTACSGIDAEDRRFRVS
jgi:hypothetical protein